VKTAIVTGPETDLRPVWSLDGTRVVFERKTSGTIGDGRLFVARDDGRGLLAITPTPQQNLASYTFSPDGTEVAFTAGPDQGSQIWVAKVDGSGARSIDVGMTAYETWFRPPNGAEIVFVGTAGGDYGSGIYAVSVSTGKVRTIVAPSVGRDLDRITIGPDGSRVAYSTAATFDSGRNSFQINVSALDGSRTITLPMPAGATFQDAAVWSNDSTRIAVTRGYAAHNDQMTLAIVPADGSSVGIESARGLTGCCDTVMQWAPDDRTILVSPEDLYGQPTVDLLLDTTSAATRPVPYFATGDPAWQRLPR
jgi:Tol biopolymer transport system component